jgi:hypothetical protein
MPPGREFPARSPLAGQPSALRADAETMSEPTLRLLNRLSRPVDISPVVYSQDDHPGDLIIYFIDHSVRPAPGGPDP